MKDNKTYMTQAEWDNSGVCPKCGCSDFGFGPWDCDGETIPSGDRDVPPDFKVYWEEWKCEKCGHIIHVSINQSPDDAHALDEDILMDKRYN